MRRQTKISAVALACSLLAMPAFAQTAAPAASTPAPSAAAPAQTSPSTVIATVNGQPIRMGDLQDAANSLPQNMQQLPPDQLFPLLVNQQIDRKALLIAATNAKLQNDPAVAQAMKTAADEKLENAYVQEKVTPAITDAAVQAEYNKNYKGKPGAAQVDARHILVNTQAEAEAIIKQLEHGADFSKLAIKDSIDPGAKDGGELGWFTHDQMVPVFADAAFALKPGTYTKTPVHSQFGWHVILCEGKRTAPAPALADVQQQIRQSIADDVIKATLADARSKVKIVMNNPAGGAANAAPGGAPAGAPPGADSGTTVNP
jgi:peptidyl-prolyl cis-trans isomerase C